ncbi:hypothetical protein GCM10022215_14490 [Nocardioides fonticola]|uniref:PEP-utilising enzyme mobile domain-containing protein n=1 Tax=Nocardioides fonticola TaxID=450363 RepID=A0ABP7XGB2_9ACTN
MTTTPDTPVAGTVIEFDTPFVGDDLYTRANAGEVFPELLSPLSWTLLGPALERGFMRCMADDFAAIEPLPGGYRACGRMAGRLHLNLSVFRTVAERAPGSSADDLDKQYFGDAVASGLPGHPKEKVPLTTTLRCTGAGLRTMASIDRRVKRETRLAAEAAAARTALLASGPTPRQALDAARGELDLYSALFGSHVTARALTASAVSLAMGALTKRGLSDDQALALISDIPDIESAKPSKELSAIAAAAAPAARSAVLEGADWAELGAATDPDIVALRTELEAFLATYGHRGVNEFDPAWPVWGTQPDAVLSLLRRILAAGAGTERARTPGEVPGGVAGFLVRNARKAIHRAENTKDNIIRVCHDLRLYLDAAFAGLAEQLTREEALALSIEELLAVADGGPVPGELIARRRAEIEAALLITPAEWSMHELTVAHEEAAAGITELVGLAGSQGVVRGRVRVMRDVDDAFEDDEVLVAATTDTAWTPLFLAAAAVVTDTGGPLSHATIVARELGIPAVVNTKTAVRDLQDGDLVEVDGTAGVVRIIERGASA